MSEVGVETSSAVAKGHLSDKVLHVLNMTQGLSVVHMHHNVQVALLEPAKPDIWAHFHWMELWWVKCQ